MSYTVLARRYRSKDFDELVGQEAVADTLKRAVEQDRVAHAYLFCGTRGVGKTSMARILARALNAVEALQDQDAVCDAIMRGDDLDVIEIDGASNRGVEQARELIAAAGLSPARSPYRIYIIDEVHMLTSEAFNTLLKTMEEPPAHVKFILCTTEPHKVPATIRSRCQRFDFKPIAMARISAHLAEVVAAEGVKVDDGVLDRVAVLGKGSMRDALSVLERLLAAGDASISMEAVERTLGLPPAEVVMQVVDAILTGDAAGTLEHAATLLQQGIALDQVIESLVDAFRTMMLLGTCGADTDLLELPDTHRVAMAQRAATASPDVFAHAVAVFEAVARQAALAASARAIFDAALVRLALGASLQDDEAPAQSSAKKKMMPAPRVEACASTPKASSPPAAGQASNLAPGAKAKAAAPKPRAESKPAPAAKPVATGGTLAEQWVRIVQAIESPATQAAAELLEPCSLDAGVLLVRSPKRNAALADRLGAVQRAAEQVLGTGVTVKLDTPAQAPPSTKVLDAQADADPMVQMVSEVFDAEVVRVRAAQEKSDNV